MLFLMFYVCLSKYFNNGPYWAPEVLAPDDCKDTWWKNILYVNNIVESDKMVSDVLMAIQSGKFVDVAHFLKTLRLYSVYTSKRIILTNKIAQTLHERLRTHKVFKKKNSAFTVFIISSP